jgi:uncharacterized cofD-like protein
MKTVVIIGGGTATFTLLQGLRQFPTNNIVIVSTADDGGSTGVLRKELGVMPMGDIRQCLIGLSYTVPALLRLFSYRFDAGSLRGHNAGNIILAALEKVTGSPEGAIAEAARLLNARGEVLFVSRKQTALSARLSDGTRIKSEHELDEPVTKKRAPIEKLALSKAEANPRALDAIARADAIVLGPGDLYTSTFPNLLVPGIAEAITAAQGRKILITNIMTKLGQTDGFKASDFVRETNRYLSREHSPVANVRTNGSGVLDTVVVNTKKPHPSILARYRSEKAAFVEPDTERIKKMGVTVIARPIVSNHMYKKAEGDVLQRSLIRHNAEKTAEFIWELIK